MSSNCDPEPNETPVQCAQGSAAAHGKLTPETVAVHSHAAEALQVADPRSEN